MERKRTVSNLFERLVKLANRLRGPKGCPWDKKQTHNSLRAYLIEEAYEVAEAIDEKNSRKFLEELGDLIYQVIFHARIAEEKNTFTLRDILEASYNKMLRRHPHVFNNKKNKKTHREILSHWQEIKLAEKKYKTHSSLMKDFSKSMPSLLRAKAVQERAKRIGFDWSGKNECFEKLLEEVREFKKGFRSGQKTAIEDEIGDMLFTIVNLSRFLHLNPEEVLHRATDKFIARFEMMEKEIEKQKKDISKMNLKEMDRFWEKVKKKKPLSQ